MPKARTLRTTPSISDMPLRGSRERKPLAGAPAKREKEILEAAVNLFHEAGYASTSVEHVANAAGMLKGSLYHYIDSKEDLLYRIVEQVHEGHADLIAEVAARTDLAPTERLDQYFREQVLFGMSNIRRIAVYWQDRDRLSPERLDAIRRWRLESSDFLVGLIEEAMAAGELPSGIDTRLATRCVRGVLGSLYVWVGPSSGMPPEVLAEFTSRFILEGIRGTADLRVAGLSPPAQGPPTRSRSKRKRRSSPPREPLDSGAA